MERPARVGRVVLVMLGAITAAVGTATWVTTGGALGVALAVFGGVLLVLGITQHFLYRRDLSHWPERAVLWDEGVELILHNGEVRGASWSDPDLLFGLASRPAPPPIVREYLLLWMRDSKIPSVEISSEGFERLRKTASTHHLRLRERRRGRRSRETLWLEIGPGMLTSATPVPPRPETRTT
jgi:hypothetical protein